MDFSGANHDLAKRLYEQLPEELRDLERLPGILVGIGIEKSEMGDYGLGFSFMPYSELRTAKVLNSQSGNFDNDDSDLKNRGIPSALGEGNRRLYTKIQQEPKIENLGLSRFFLVGFGCLGASSDFLASSDVSGRVVLISAEGASQEVARAVKYFASQKSDLERTAERFRKAEAVLRGE